MEAEERLSKRFLDMLYEEFRERRHIIRIGPIIGPIIWKICRVAKENPTVPRRRYIRFVSGGRKLKAHYLHRLPDWRRGEKEGT